MSSPQWTTRSCYNFKYLSKKNATGENQFLQPSNLHTFQYTQATERQERYLLTADNTDKNCRDYLLQYYSTNKKNNFLLAGTSTSTGIGTVNDKKILRNVRTYCIRKKMRIVRDSPNQHNLKIQFRDYHHIL